MTKPNFTSINIVLDRSGSMSSLSAETIANFNKFVAEQKLVPGEAVLSLATFATDYTLIHNCVPLQNVEPITSISYTCGGSTALLDATARLINDTGITLANMPEHERPSRVVFVVITDGQENASKEFSKARVMEMVKHQTDKYSWCFVYIGSDLAGVQSAGAYGFSVKNSVPYVATSAGTGRLYDSISQNMTSYRSSLNVDASNFFNPANSMPIQGQIVDNSIIPTTTIPTPKQ